MSLEICNVNIFDGINQIKQNKVVMENGIISDKTKGDMMIDGSGCTLLPGLIDSHIHLNNPENLRQAAEWGITTMLDMAASVFVDDLKNKPGLTDIFTCYKPALYPIENAESFVKEQVNLGADYIKIIIDDSSPKALDFTAVKAIVQSAHHYKKQVIAHTVTLSAMKMALDANVDILTHIPLEASIPESIIEIMKSKKTVIVPTMVMMKEIAAAGKSAKFSHVEASVKSIIQAGVPVVAGTDANHSTYAPVNIAHGISLHDELELYVAAGMTPVQALQSATSTPASIFGFNDRGVIEIGRRADLLLVEGDPTQDISNTKRIKNVWIAGIQVQRQGEII